MRNALTAIGKELGPQECVSIVGVALLAIGVWLVSPAAALMVTGAVLLWAALPPRPPFVMRREPKSGAK